MIQNRQDLSKVKRLVVKIGSGVLVENGNRIHLDLLDALSAKLAEIVKSGRELLLVSSGAIAFGMLHLGLQQRPQEVSKKQACAAIGQSHLIHRYEQLFSRFGIKVAQVLLSRDDLENPKRLGNARQTFEELFTWKILPIVNENDSVMVEELKFGDNDNLSAHVAVAVKAELLVILSHVDGVYTADPELNPDATLIPQLSGGGLSALSGVSSRANSALNTGGMQTKIEAASRCSANGIATAIVNGRSPENLLRFINGEAVGTLILP